MRLVPAQSDAPVGSLLSAEAAPNALSPPVEPVSHKRKEKSQIDKHIQLKADIVLAGLLATSGAKLDGFGLLTCRKAGQSQARCGPARLQRSIFGASPTHLSGGEQPRIGPCRGGASTHAGRHCRSRRRSPSRNR